MVYFWDLLEEGPDELIGQYDRAVSGNRFLLKRGERVPAGFREPVFRFPCPVSALRAYDDLANSAMVPLVSPRVVAVLQALSVNVQLLPSTVVAADGKLTDYKTLVALDLVKAIDLERSEYSCVPGTGRVMGFRRISMYPDPLGYKHLARAAEYPSYLLASQALRDALLQQRVQGLGLYSLEELSL